jgi:hypothetical protein
VNGLYDLLIDAVKPKYRLNLLWCSQAPPLYFEDLGELGEFHTREVTVEDYEHDECGNIARDVYMLSRDGVIVRSGEAAVAVFLMDGWKKIVSYQAAKQEDNMRVDFFKCGDGWKKIVSYQAAKQEDNMRVDFFKCGEDMIVKALSGEGAVEMARQLSTGYICFYTGYICFYTSRAL